MAGSVPPCPHTLGTPQILGDLLHVCRVFLSPCRVSVSQLFSYIMRKGREVGLPGRTIWCVCVAVSFSERLNMMSIDMSQCGYSRPE